VLSGEALIVGSMTTVGTGMVTETGADALEFA
jgi:hypothetical protein